MGKVKETLKKIPLVQKLYRMVREPRFKASDSYWEGRYQSGGTSGPGSHGKLALFKAEVLNRFVKDNDVQTVIEFGCGDGNQLTLAEYPCYIGLDVALSATQACANRFKDDPTKSFFLYDGRAFADNARVFSADLSMSLDVVYHLVEDQIYLKYMSDLFASARKYVVVYSSNEDKPASYHVRERKFTTWVDANAPEWKLKEKLANPYHYDPKDVENTSIADFYIFENATSPA